MECEYTEECPARDRSEHGQCGEPGECCRSAGNMDNTSLMTLPATLQLLCTIISNVAC